MTLRAAILDIDGTLIDTNDGHAHAWVDALREFGREVAFGEVRPLIGMGGDKVMPRLTGGLDEASDEGKRIKARRGEIFQERYLPSCRPFPQARELLERMRGGGLTLVVATSASKDDMKALLEKIGVADLIEARTSASDAEESKPDPDIIHAALDSAGVSAAEAVMLGDTPYDVEAAGRAGVPTIALRCGGWWKDDDFRDAAEIYDDPAELLARYEGSLLGTAGG
ncbi:MAG TPA: HAD family hydrolase [Longimicrobium sp.]|nr:HAD family hydrolase [Longimicrobium sp.]